MTAFRARGSALTVGRGAVRRPLLLLTAAFFVLCAPAGATERVVQTTGNDSSSTCSASSPCLTLQRAFDVAGSGDTVTIGPGRFVAGPSPTTTKALTITGSGSKGALATELKATTGTEPFAVVMKGGGSIAHLRLRGDLGLLATGPTTSAGPALDYAISDIDAANANGSIIVSGYSGPTTASISDVRVVTSGIAFQASGSHLQATLAHVSADVTADSSLSTAFYFDYGADGAVTDASASGTGLGLLAQGVSGAAGGPEESHVTLRRTRIDVGKYALYTASGTIDARDSLLAGGPTAVWAQSSAAANGASTIALRRTTVSSDGANARAVMASGFTAGAQPAKVSLTDSIVRAAGIAPQALEADGTPATISAERTIFSTSQATSGGTVPAPGSGSNLDVDPHFTNVSARDFTLAAGSPALDRGDPALIEPGDADATGAPRSADGDGDCNAAPDLGAFERTGVACPAAPVTPPPPTPAQPPAPSLPVAPIRAPDRTAPKLTKVKFTAGKLTLTVSEAATVKITLKRCRTPTKHCTTRTRTQRAKVGSNSYALGKLTTGFYTVSLMATDTAGNRAKTVTVSFRKH
jgi:hypothetical protein